MADLSGTDLVYNYRDQTGLTSLTFRKRRYVFPSIIVTDKDTPRSTSPCLMLDVGLFCPHCTSAITGHISGSHSKLTISKDDHGAFLSKADGSENRHLSMGHPEGGTEQWEPDNVNPSIAHVRSKHAHIKSIKPGGVKAGTSPSQPVSSGDHEGDLLESSFGLYGSGKQSSSDYESLDRDSNFGSNTAARANSCLPYPGSEQSKQPPDDAYSSMMSSGQEHVYDPDLWLGESELENFWREHTTCTTTSDVIPTAENTELVDVHGSEASKSCEKDPGERSASPETFVDAILENMSGEVFSVDATLPRVFSLRSDRHQSHSHRNSRKPFVPHEIHNTETYQRLDRNGKYDNQHEQEASKGDDTMNKKPIQTRTTSDLGTVKSISGPEKIRNPLKTSVSHEEFFEDVLEALAELEEGFVTSDYDSDTGDTPLFTPESRHALHHQHTNTYTDNLLRYENQDHKQATLSGECVSCDGPRDIHVTDAPSETHEYSTEGLASGTECHSELPVPSRSGSQPERLIEETNCDTTVPSRSGSQPERLIEETNSDTNTHLTNTDKILASQSRNEQEHFFQFKDQYNITDEVFLDNKCEECNHIPLETKYFPRSCLAKSSDISLIPKDIVAEQNGAALYCRDDDLDTTENTSSECSSINESSSLENLLTCNELHCSTSDLDEPYTTELKHNGISNISSVPGDTNDGDEGAEDCVLEEDCKVRTQISDIADSDSQANEANSQYLKSLVGNHHITYNSSHETNADINTARRSQFDTQLQSGEWKDFSSEADTEITSFVSKDNMSKEQAQQFLKYVLHKSSHEELSHSHTTDLDACLDEVCQTCQLKPKAVDEVVKNEEVTTQEVTFVFAWPKKLTKGKRIVPVPRGEASQPFRTVHLRRVMRVSDFDMEVLEGPTVETLEYKDGNATRTVKAYERPITVNNATEYPVCPSSLETSTNALTSLKESDDVLCDRRLKYEKQLQQSPMLSEVTRKNRVDEGTLTNSGDLHKTHRDSGSTDGSVLPNRDLSETHRDSGGTDGSVLSNKGDLQQTHRDSSGTFGSVLLNRGHLDETYWDSESTDGSVLLIEGDIHEKRPDSGGTFGSVLPNEGYLEETHRDSGGTDGSVLPNEGDLEETHWDSQRAPTSRDVDRDVMDREVTDPIFIQQHERNIKLLNIDKYFAPAWNSEETKVINNAEENDTLQRELELKRQLFVLQPSKHTDSPCSDCLLRRHSNDAGIQCLGTVSDHPQSRHPQGCYPEDHNPQDRPLVCERCIMLEREVKQKLEELSSMVEDMGNPQRGIVNHVTSTDMGDPQRGIVNHVTSTDMGDPQKGIVNHVASTDMGDPQRGIVNHVTSTDINGTDTCTTACSKYPTANQTRGGSLFQGIRREGFEPLSSEDPGIEVDRISMVTGGSATSVWLINEIQTYAENLSKYILFRSKLYIVLNKTTTNCSPGSNAKQKECILDDFRTN